MAPAPAAVVTAVLLQSEGLEAQEEAATVAWWSELQRQAGGTARA